MTNTNTDISSALRMAEKSLRTDLDVTKKELATINKKIDDFDKNRESERKLITRSEEANVLSPEDIYDILKNKNGWFSRDYSDDVIITWHGEETDVEYNSRYANDTETRIRLVEQRDRLKARHNSLEKQLIGVKALLKKI